MNFKRIARILICLVLVCCLVVDISPIKANALEPATITVAASVGILGAIIGLCGGIAKNTTADFLNNYISSCKNFLTLNYNFITDDDKIKVWSTANPDMPYAVDWEFIEAVRSFLWDNEVCQEISIPEGYAHFNGHSFPVLPDNAYLYPYRLIVGTNPYYLYTSTAPFVVTLLGTEYTFKPSFEASVSWFEVFAGTWKFGHNSDNTTGAVSTKNIAWSSHDLDISDGDFIINGAEPITESGVIVPDGLVAGHIAPQKDPFEDGYPIWAGNSIDVPTSSGGTIGSVKAAPIALGNTPSDMLGFTQEQVWAGAGSYIDTSTPDIDSGATGTGDLVEVISILESISKYQQTGSIGIQTKIEGLSDTLENTNDLLSDSNALIDTLISANAYGFDTVVDSILSLPNSIGKDLSDVEDLIGGISSTLGHISTKTIAEVLAETLAGVLAIPQSVARAIADVLAAVFIPSEAFVATKVDALTEEFKFADSIAKAGKDMDEFLSTLGSKPPVIYIDLGAAEGRYNWGRNMVLIDFSFYGKYKAEMDMILSAFLYLWLVWRLILNLPGIISGASGIVGAFNSAAHAGSSGFPAVQNTSGPSSAPVKASSNTKSERGSLFTPMPGGTTHYEQWRAKQK